MPRRNYSDKERIDALLALAANGGNILRTVHETGIPENTIRHWRDGDRHAEVSQMGEEKKLSLADEAEAAARLLLGDVWDKARRKRAGLKDVATAFGILTDKMQLLRGKATSINQHDLSSMSDDELTRELEAVRRARAALISGNETTNGEAASP